MVLQPVDNIYKDEQHVQLVLVVYKKLLAIKNQKIFTTN